MTTITTEFSEIDPECDQFALFSGGNESLVSSHFAYENYDIDWTVYLDTNSGLEENLDHVKSVCKSQGWDLLIAQSPHTLKEFALELGNGDPFGFPGPAAHSWAYRYFKGRPLRKIAKNAEEKPRFYTGVRSHESDRRMANVDGRRKEIDRWIWVAPIHDWRDHRVDEYRQERDLPVSPVVEKIGRSGDCYCGAYAHRDTELAELEAHYPDHAEWILKVEEEVQEEFDPGDKNAYWGFGNMSKKELRKAMVADDDAQMTLCSSCDVPNYPTEEENNER